MGTFFTNLQVRGESREAVVNAVRRAVKENAYVSGPNGGWVTVYEERGEVQDEAKLGLLAGALSEELGTAVMWFLVHDSDVLKYGLYESGELVDEYCSIPDYFGEVSETERKRLRGQPERLIAYCAKGTKVEQVREALEGGGAFAENTLRQLGGLMGMDEDRCGMGFAHYETAREEGSADGFELVGGGKSRRTKRAARPRKSGGPSRAGIPPLPVSPALKLAQEEHVRLRSGESVDDYVVAIGTLVAMTIPTRQYPTVVQALGWDVRKMAVATKKFVLGNVGCGPWGTITPGQPTGEELYAACMRGVEEIAGLVATRTPQVLDACAREAARGQPEFLRALLDRGVGVNARDSEGRSLLLVACLHFGDGGGCGQLLVERGANVNLADARGTTPLMYAALEGNATMVEALVAAGADARMRRDDGHTAVSMAELAAGDVFGADQGKRVLELLQKSEEKGRDRGGECG